MALRLKEKLPISLNYFNWVSKRLYCLIMNMVFTLLALVGNYDDTTAIFMMV